MIATTAAHRRLVEIDEAVRAPLTHLRRIDVTAWTPGSGTSTTARALAAAFARRRSTDVVVTDDGVRPLFRPDPGGTAPVTSSAWSAGPRPAAVEEAFAVAAAYPGPLVLALVEIEPVGRLTRARLRRRSPVPTVVIGHEPALRLAERHRPARMPYAYRIAHLALAAALMLPDGRTRPMTVRLVHRPTRITAPLPAVTPEAIAAPPTNPDTHAGSMRIHVLLPVLGALSSVILIVVLRGNNRLFLIIGAILLVVALTAGIGLALSTRGGAARKRRMQRENYLDYLERLRFDLRARGRRPGCAPPSALDPAPEALVPLVGDPARLWERRRATRDFLQVRVGIGNASDVRPDACRGAEPGRAVRPDHGSARPRRWPPITRWSAGCR